MKYALLILFLMPVICFSQKDTTIILPKEDGKITYTKIISLDSLKKNDIYLRLKNWALGIYNSKESQIADDKDAGYLAYMGYISELKVTHLLKCYIKDSKVKMVLSDFYIYNYSDDKKPLEIYEREKLNEYIERKMRNKKVTQDYVPAFDMLMKYFLSSAERAITNKSEFDF